MGIRYLYYCMDKTVPNGSVFTDLKSEVQEFKRLNNGKTPTIVIDLFSIESLFCENSHEKILSGRYDNLRKEMEKCLTKLKSLGIKLIFVADGPLQGHKVSTIIDRRNEIYAQNLLILQLIDSGTNILEIIEDNEENIGRLLPFRSVMLEIAAKYGEVHISFENECDILVAKIATESNAMAVISNDTDFLIFEGNWKLWFSPSLNFENLTVQELNRAALRDFLRLFEKQMPYFATLSGTDILKISYLEDLHDSVRQGISAFEGVAELVRQETTIFGEITDKALDRFVNLINLRNNKEIKSLIKASVDSYKYECMKEPENQDDLSEILRSYRYLFHFSILNNYKTLINLFYFDLSYGEFMPLYDLVMPLIKREMGILLKHLNDVDVSRIFICKKEHESSFQEFEETAVYPSMKVPPLFTLFSVPYGKDLGLDDDRINLLCWMISPYLNPKKVQDLPSECSTAVLAIFYLFEKRQITLEEADCLLLANCQIDEMRPLQLQDITKINGRDARIAFLFTDIQYYITTCYSTVGLGRLTSTTKFDGLYFHYFRKLKNAARKNEQIQKFLHLRLHAENI